MNFSKAIYLSIIFMAVSLAGHAQWERYTPPEGEGFALLELFTSEGCSSCPAADKAMVQLSEEYKHDFYTLEFHVDYWNHLGWKDKYSDKRYTDRQRHYADLFKGSRFTPQVIINGGTSVVGSDKAKIRPFVNQERLKEPRSKLSVSATAHRDRVYVAYRIDNTRHQWLNIALVLRHARTEVLKGENEGRNLNHVNIVRDYKTIELLDDHGFVEVNLPPGTVAEECSIIAYTQKKRTWQVTSVAKCAISPEDH